jgi:L-lactate dehydrogenase complex protein LldE
VRVGLFATCLGEAFSPGVPIATVSVLERLGHQVLVPRKQTCCGQMHTNSGFAGSGTALAEKLVSAFADCEAVVAPSSSCVGHLRDFSPDMPIFELSEFLVHRLGVLDLGARFPHRVAYHPSCHSLRVARVGDAPTQLLSRVAGLSLVPYERDWECCGFGGTFAVKNSGVSSAMLADKCDELEAAGPEYCAAVDSSCLMHLGGGLSRRRSAVRTIHLAEILASR